MGFFDSIFGGGGQSIPDNSAAFAQFANQMRQNAGSYDPWINTGNQARDLEFGQFQNLINNPNALQDKIASGFNTSPYQNQILDRVGKMMNFNAANTGFLGSGAGNVALQDELTKNTGQFLNDYVNRGMSSYGQGLSGLDSLTRLGMNALGSKNDMLQQADAGDLQGALSRNAYNAYQNANSGSGLSNLIGMGIGIAGNAMMPGMGSFASSLFSGMSGGGGGGGSPLGLNGIFSPNSMGGYTQSYGAPDIGALLNLGASM
jgi:hypothetical protein